jgi:hypothetical protein
MKRSAILTLAALALAGCGENDDMLSPNPDLAANEGREASEVAPRAMYEVTVENLTMAGGQHFTPPVIVISQKAADLFTPGKAASYEIQQVAENGGIPHLVGLLEASKHVSSFDVATSGMGLEGPLAPGESVTRELYADPGSNFFSAVSMLICTNDGFTGVDGGKLPNKVGETSEWYAGAYDAGTEENTEDYADLVPPCQALNGMDVEPGSGMSDPALAEGGVIHHHQGIQGGSDLDPILHGWTDPVAKFTVKRIG